jgi:hypothetical protein
MASAGQHGTLEKHLPPAVLLGLECLSINVGCLAGFRQSVVDSNQTSYRFAIVFQYAAMDQFSV